MRRLSVLGSIGLGCVALAGCDGDWRAKAVADAEALLRQVRGDPALKFAHVAVTGDSSSGQACGYFERPSAYGSTTSTRFIYFIDGAGGQNPFIDDPATPYPANKSDFALNWRTQCLELGYAY